MKLAIMQPYLFPYIGYFQLAAAADKFVFYDDVNFIKNGWINRNRVLLNGEARYITIPLAGASPSLKINEVLIEPRDRWLRKLLESIRHAYRKAPHYARISELIGEILSAPVEHIAMLASHTVVEVCNYLELETEFVASSAQYGNEQLRGASRVIDICAMEKADLYLNLPGGRALYDADTFAARGIELAFIEPNLRAYEQSGAAFQPALSILDVLMFNTRDRVRDMLAVEVIA
ncbi:hypothetical protein P3T18_002204 [Paraburkholderia sp. GAS199]|uniref:WbqC family protein n=1 Tax=Paraburkholderia sp. GAS199 TaxID=3035126 RepID=UPI003D1B408F